MYQHCSVAVELVEYQREVPDAESARHFFADLAEQNEALNSTVSNRSVEMVGCCI
jgi:hypothetical protein